ncbi:MAG: hypothetical protein NW216_04200 [Hyphomicrobium sp.]|nr:hypothetical protein [Hyphomicrobium sp.]
MQYYQGLVSGTVTKDGENGCKLDAFATLDSSKFGLWNGLFVSIHRE